MRHTRGGGGGNKKRGRGARWAGVLCVLFVAVGFLSLPSPSYLGTFFSCSSLRPCTSSRASASVMMNGCEWDGEDGA